MAISPAAGRLAEASDLVNVPRLVTAYFADRPDPKIPAQRVSFGTSGHRGSSLNRAFNEWHILAITQAICALSQRAGNRRTALYRHRHARAFRAGFRERAGSAGGEPRGRE